MHYVYARELHFGEFVIANLFLAKLVISKQPQKSFHLAGETRTKYNKMTPQSQIGSDC